VLTSAPRFRPPTPTYYPHTDRRVATPRSAKITTKEIERVRDLAFGTVAETACEAEVGVWWVEIHRAGFYRDGFVVEESPRGGGVRRDGLEVTGAVEGIKGRSECALDEQTDTHSLIYFTSFHFSSLHPIARRT
jgi:hypothetical protein